MANVLRTAGGTVAVLVLALDASKGALSVVLAWAVADTGEAMAVAGLAAVAGHNWSIFLAFKGGRGVATSLGGLLVMQPIAGAIGVAVFLPVALTSRYVSAGSLSVVATAFLATLVMAAIDRAEYVYLLYAGVAGLIVTWQHRGNIARLWKGTEPRLGQPAEGLAGLGAGRGGPQ